MLEKLLLNLQLFGEGGDGGDGGEASPTGEGVSGNSGEDLIPASIPEKAKKYYEKAKAKNPNTSTSSSQTPSNAQTTTTETNNATNTTEKIPYADLIKSDDYKDAHKEYMDKTIGDRLKKYKGIEEDLGKHKGLLEIVATKYGINPDDENFLEVLRTEIEADNSYYEDYAMKHDMSVEQAREIVNMERKVAQINAQEEARQKEEQARQQFAVVLQNAEKTKKQFPEFDLETEMQNEKFRRLCAVTNGDTTSAYVTCHWNDIVPNAVHRASEQAKLQTAQAVASNMARPIENGLSSSAPSVVQQDFSKMGLKELRAYADEQRRKQTGR